LGDAPALGWFRTVRKPGGKLEFEPHIGRFRLDPSPACRAKLRPEARFDKLYQEFRAWLGKAKLAA
jgi:hypothetical protein